GESEILVDGEGRAASRGAVEIADVEDDRAGAAGVGVVIEASGEQVQGADGLRSDLSGCAGHLNVAAADVEGGGGIDAVHDVIEVAVVEGERRAVVQVDIG